MYKNFDSWNKDKKRINRRDSAPYCHEREIWWCSLGVNVGYEQDGGPSDYRRPVLVLKNFSVGTCMVIPLTTSNHKHPFRPSVGAIEGIPARALISQMRVIDTRRLVRKIGYLDQKLFEEIRKTAKAAL
jgi:mRNA-degrading endonuclease toxin of MazEF toxin-antitoxin module